MFREIISHFYTINPLSIIWGEYSHERIGMLHHCEFEKNAKHIMMSMKESTEREGERLFSMYVHQQNRR